MSRKIIIIVSILIAGLSGVFADGWMAFYNEKILIIGEGLRIRDEPSIEGKIVGRLSYGDVVTGEWNEKYKCVSGKEETINGRKNLWLYIRTDEGLTGWVFMEYIACPFIKYDDRIVYVEYKEREFKWVYGSDLYEQFKERGEEKSLHKKLITPILVVKYPDKRVEIELDYFKNNNHRLVHLYPFKMKEIKIWDGVYTLIIKADILPWNFDMGAGGEGGSRHNYLFKYDRDKIDRIFEYEDSYGNVMSFIKENGRINEIGIYRQSKRSIITKNDFDKILEKLTVENQKKLKKYYYLVEPKINDENLKENILSFREYFSIEELNEDDKKIFNKYIYCAESFGCKFYNIKSQRDVEIVNDLYNRNKNSLYIAYQLKPDLDFEQLKDARDILKEIGFGVFYEDDNYKTFIWNEKEFIEEEKK